MDQPSKSQMDDFIKKLEVQADDLDRQGDQFKNCSFMGEHPSSGYYKAASDIRMALILLKARKP